jgi:beta-galactosidase
LSQDCSGLDSPADGSMTSGDSTDAEIRKFTINRSRSRNAISLNGNWEVQPTSDDSVPSSFLHTIPVPSLVDMASPPYDWEKAKFHWHKLEFAIDNLDLSNAVFLRIGQSQYGTQIWLNGHHIGESISCYTSQEYRMNPWIRNDQSNILIIRIGDKSNLPPESAVGNDQEKQAFIPGIWGDVSLVVTSRIRVKRTRVVSNLTNGIAQATIILENLDEAPRSALVRAQAFEKGSGRSSSVESVRQAECKPGENVLNISIPIDDPKLWSPDNPFLYLLRIVIELNGSPSDELDTTFGMREFKIVGDHFVLNGKKVLLRGGNIAFHRFLGDPQRKGLPWDREWIQRLLVDIPKAHNFNSFRFHLGQVYSAWYDIADEYGMLIQNEWQFWRASGTKDQIVREFTEWIHDNSNHPSIVIWDALNECSEPMVENEVIPIMKDADRTRPWEPNDFPDHHPYIYSLGPVLSDRRFGFASSIEDMESQSTPLVVNEFLWWWLNNDGKPTSLMKGVVERWMGSSASSEALLEHQAWLAQEMVELFRRLDADTIQPFVYLSNGDGPTGNWFLKDISYLQTKPILGALGNAFAPLGVSIELWDRHFVVAEKRSLRIFAFNDYQRDCEAELKAGIVDSNGDWISQKSENIHLGASSNCVRTMDIAFPNVAGEFRIKAEIRGKESPGSAAFSEKIVLVFEQVVPTDGQNNRRVCLLDAGEEVREFLQSRHVQTVDWDAGSFERAHVFMVNGESLRMRAYELVRDRLALRVSDGATLVLMEPEIGVEGEREVDVLEGVTLKISKRVDKDRGGYDSYVFPEDNKNEMWNGIPPNALKMFNGALGGEIVSQHDVIPSAQYKVLARCGLGLNVLAAAEIPYGGGRIILSRFQVRGRLMEEGGKGLYDRRVDPVAQRFLLNLLAL